MQKNLNARLALTEKKYFKRKINKISLIESLPYEDSTENSEVSELEVNEPEEVSKSDKIQTKLKRK